MSKSNKRTSRSSGSPRPRSCRQTFRNFFLKVFFSTVQIVMRQVFKLIYGPQGKSMPAITNPILLESATSLANKIRSQELTSVAVMKAFIERIREVNPLLNCCVDERFDEALTEAAAADDLIKSGKNTVEELARDKPFLGVPLSTKDCISVKGMLHTAGLWSRKDVHADEDADSVALMRAAGAIPFAITNVSEVCMWWESNNTVHGRTNNAYDTNRIVGGSSGGEGCIQAAAASACGLGSDIGGSIRMPAFFNGIFGHKPTKFVVSNKGQFPMPFSTEQSSFLGIGPMVRHAEDLKPMLKIIAAKNAAELRLDEPVDVSKVRFFYQENDGGGVLVSEVEKDIAGSLKGVVEHLKKKFETPVERVELNKFRQSAAIWFANMQADSHYTFEYQLGNMKYAVNPYIELVKWLFCLSRHTFIGLITAITEKNQCRYGSKKYHHMVKKRDELREEIQQFLGDDGVLIYPTHPTVAPYHNEPIYRPLNFSYTGIVNVLGFPATAVPLGLSSDGLPLGVQVIANFHQDRLCLAVAEELERAFGGWVRPKVNLSTEL